MSSVDSEINRCHQWIVRLIDVISEINRCHQWIVRLIDVISG